jgi:hypothetical protein
MASLRHGRLVIVRRETVLMVGLLRALQATVPKMTVLMENPLPVLLASAPMEGLLSVRLASVHMARRSNLCACRSLRAARRWACWTAC